MSAMPKKSKHYKLDFYTIALLEVLKEMQPDLTYTDLIERSVHTYATTLIPEEQMSMILHEVLRLQYSNDI